ncbi:hypothetical protein AALP_AA3G131600 [Arabis alpina]|uniref:OBG-type G domain-containing protein n=1 Tax=Arabis alpina TaxID=50452 RepID=A0A087H8X5_ARAAL|nr:hypothetical protein AALP_AA3G131600 [Arabis alpina]
MQFDYKNINVVPIGNEFFDHVPCQTPTPNLLRKGFRQFYTREVKKTELTFRDKLSTIIQQFPRNDEINPLYSDLLRLIFDRDRYKLVLGQVSTAKHLVTKIANDYVKQIEFSESLKQCKALKVSGVARMFSVVDEITPGLAYLEQLRQHMVKLPLIDPNSPTLLVSGYPSVDKTCFMNRVGGFDDDITAKFETFVVGYTDYKGLMYQVIDAPGVLDRSVFGECDVVTALASHLQAALVVFFLDVSGSCGYSIAYQAALFYSLKSLFVNKPFLIVCDEADLMEVSEQDLELIDEMNGGMIEGEEEVVLKIRNLSTEEGVMSVKNAACERLLDQIERLNGIAQDKAEYLRKKCILAIQEWKDNIVHQNIDDDHKHSDLLVDPDVLFRLEELEREEGLNQAEDDEEESFVMAEECFREKLNDQLVSINREGIPSCLAHEKVERWMNKYILPHQEWIDNIIPQNLDDDHHHVSEFLVDSEHEEGLKQPEDEEEEEEEEEFVMAEECFRDELSDQLVGDSLSCTAREKVDCWKDKYILAHQEWKDNKIPQTLDDDNHNVSDLLVHSEHEEGLKKAKEEGFVIAEERFKEEHKDHQLVPIRKIQALGIFIGLAFFILVGNTYGTIQQCLSAFSFSV